MDGTFAVDDSTILVFLGRLLVLLMHRNAFDDDAILGSQHFDDGAGGTFVVTGDHLNGVSFFDSYFFAHIGI